MREKIPRCVTTVGISRARSRVRVAAVCPWAPSDARTRALFGPSIDRVVRETLAASAPAFATVPAARALAPARWETLDRPITTSADAERAEIDGDAPRFCIVRLARAARADPSSCPAAGAAAASEGGSPAGGSPGGACAGRASCGARSTEVSKARFVAAIWRGNATVDIIIFPSPQGSPGSGVKRALTVGTSVPAAGTCAAAGTSAAGRSWGARRSPAGGSLAASSPSASRNVCPGPLRQLGANACALGLWVCATGGARSLFLCVAFEELEARGRAREPRSAGQRRRVVRNGRSAGPGGRDDYANASSRQQGGGFLLAIFVPRRTNLKPTLIAARLELALRKLESKGEIESAPMSAGNFPKSNFCRRKAPPLCTTRASARVVPQTRASRRWGFGR